MIYTSKHAKKNLNNTLPATSDCIYIKFVLEVKSLVESGKSPKVGFHRVIILIPKSLVKISGKYTQVALPPCGMNATSQQYLWS